MRSISTSDKDMSLMDNSLQERVALRQFLHDNIDMFTNIIRAYVWRMGLHDRETTQTLVNDILHEATIEALAHAERFKNVNEPRAWFLGIATNVLKRKRSTLIRRFNHEDMVSDLLIKSETDRESDFFDLITSTNQPGPEQEFEIREQVLELLNLVSPDDQQLLRLAISHNMDSTSLAHTLNVAPGTARVRLHRALNRLRTAWKRNGRIEGKES